MAETILMPKLGFDMAEGTLVRWVKGEGDAVNKGEVLAEIETDKATVEVESGFSGVVARHLVEQGAIVPVGTPIAIVAAPGEKVEEAAPSAPVAEVSKPKPEAPAVQAAGGAPAASLADEGGMVKASPLARRIAAEKNVHLSQIVGSGPGGRIVRKDVEAYTAALKVTPVQPVPAAPVAAAAAVPVVQPATWGQAQVPADEHVAVNKLRGAIGRRMVESKQAVPHFYIGATYDVAALLKLRKEVNENLPEDQKISVNDFIVKAVALTLRQFPNLNASLVKDEIIRHGHVNVGIAVAVDNGLLTVVVKDADQKPLRLIAGEVKELVNRARGGKVRPDDIEGSTFSISNLGMYDVDEFIAIINPPETGILAVGAAKQVPVVVDGQIQIGTRMQATISADHRVTDGAEAARFMQTLKSYLEKPLLLLL